jgi:hypothetical protein
MDNASSPRYAWDKFPEDTDLARALTSHAMQQRKDQSATVNSNMDSPVVPSKAKPGQRRQWMIDILNESAAKNQRSNADDLKFGWKPGTLDVLALAKNGLETFSDSEQMKAMDDIINALPHMNNQTQAREFTVAFMPLLSSWLKRPTNRTDLFDVDSVKRKRLLEFFSHINTLDGGRNRPRLEIEELRENALGIQRALYTALPPKTFKVFDEALPPDLVYSVTCEIKEIGDTLLNSPTFANDDPARTQIQTTRDLVDDHCQNAVRRRAELIRENATRQEPPVTQNSPVRLEVVFAENDNTPPNILPSLLSAPTSPLQPFSQELTQVSPLPASASSSLVAEDSRTEALVSTAEPSSSPEASEASHLSEPVPSTPPVAERIEVLGSTAEPPSSLVEGRTAYNPGAALAETPQNSVPLNSANPDSQQPPAPAKDAKKSWDQMNKQERRTWTDEQLGYSLTRGQRAAELAINTIRKWDCTLTAEERKKKRTDIKQNHLDNKGR